MMINQLGRLAGISVLLITLTEPASGAFQVYGFTRITNNAPQNIATQLAVKVADEGAAGVSFEFRNYIGTGSSITEVYFDDGTLLAQSTISDSGLSVAFTGGGANPNNLPGGGPINFNATQAFSADVKKTADGVDALGEWLKILYTLQAGQTYNDTITAIALGLASPGVDVLGGLRIGLHVRSIGSESDSFVNGPGGFTPPGGSSNPVPEPASVLMWLSLGATCMVCRRFRRHQA